MGFWQSKIICLTFAAVLRLGDLMVLDRVNVLCESAAPFTVAVFIAVVQVYHGSVQSRLDGSLVLSAAMCCKYP